MTRARLHVDAVAAVDDFLQAGAVFGNFDHRSLISLAVRFFPGMTPEKIAALPKAKENAAKGGRHIRSGIFYYNFWNILTMFKTIPLSH